MALVRVRHNGLEFDTGASHAQATGLEVIATDVEPSPPTRLGGRPRKPKVDLSSAKQNTTTAPEEEN